MGMRQIRGTLAIAATAVILAGCNTTEPEDSTPAMEPESQAPVTTTRSEPVAQPEAMKPTVTSRGKIQLPALPGDSSSGAGEVLQGIFYFDFDQAIVKRAGHAELNKHAKVLADDRRLRVRLEGHADERGTREYNLGLSERRGFAVEELMDAQGGSDNQMTVVPYGEERPATECSEERCWSQNRRVEIIYTKVQ